MSVAHGRMILLPTVDLKLYRPGPGPRVARTRLSAGTLATHSLRRLFSLLSIVLSPAYLPLSVFLFRRLAEAVHHGGCGSSGLGCPRVGPERR